MEQSTPKEITDKITSYYQKPKEIEDPEMIGEDSTMDTVVKQKKELKTEE
jgi:hypothetical protein